MFFDTECRIKLYQANNDYLDDSGWGIGDFNLDPDDDEQYGDDYCYSISSTTSTLSPMYFKRSTDIPLIVFLHLLFIRYTLNPAQSVYPIFIFQPISY